MGMRNGNLYVDLFFEKEDHGDYLCEELGYHSSTKTEQTEC